MVAQLDRVVVREAAELDRSFIFSLSPSLAAVAKLEWHKIAVVQEFQDNYIAEMLNMADSKKITLIAESGEMPLGFIHACESKDAISGETCGTIPLLAVAQKAQGMGVGKLLMSAAEKWAKSQDYRLLHLEVFSNNENAKEFYQNLDFKPETLVMIKSLEN